MLRYAALASVSAFGASALELEALIDSEIQLQSEIEALVKAEQ